MPFLWSFRLPTRSKRRAPTIAFNSSSSTISSVTRGKSRCRCLWRDRSGAEGPPQTRPVLTQRCRKKRSADSSVPSTSSAFLRRPARARNRDRSRRCCAAKGCILRTCRNGGALGEKGRGRDPVTVENEQLRKENARLRQRLEQAETILAIQKKASELLGIPLNRPSIADDE